MLAEDFTIIDVDNNPGATFTLKIGGQNHENYNVVDGSVEDNTIQPNLHHFGEIDVNVFVTEDNEVADDGGPLYSEVFPINDPLLTVYPIPDPPVIEGLSDDAILESDEEVAFIVSNTFFNITDPDDLDGSGEYSVVVSDNADYTYIGNEVTPDLDHFGDLTIKVTAVDGEGNSSEELFDYNLM